MIMVCQQNKNNNHNNNHNNNNKKKSIQWASSCSVRVFEMNNEQQRLDAWYQGNDYTTFRRQSRVTARLAGEIGTAVVEQHFGESCRGLEHVISKKMAATRLKRRNEAYFLVLGEQQQQQQQQQQDEDSCTTAAVESISKLYRTVSASSELDAYQMAARYFTEEEETNRTTKAAKPVTSTKKTHSGSVVFSLSQRMRSTRVLSHQRHIFATEA